MSSLGVGWETVLTPVKAGPGKRGLNAALPGLDRLAQRASLRSGVTFKLTAQIAPVAGPGRPLGICRSERAALALMLKDSGQTLSRLPERGAVQNLRIASLPE